MGRLVSAALAAVVCTACWIENISGSDSSSQGSGAVIAADTIETGGGQCIRQVVALGLTTTQVNLASVGSTADLQVQFLGNCPPNQHYDWASLHPEIAAITSLDSLTGRATGEGPGTTGAYARNMVDNSHLNFTITVGGSNACSVSNWSVNAGLTALTVGQTTQIVVTQTSNPANCASVSYTSSGAVSVTQSGLVTANSAGTGTITVLLSTGQTQTITYTVTSPSLVVSPSAITLTNCNGYQVNWPVSVTAGGTSVAITSMTSSNPSVATANGSTVSLTGTAGSATITVNTASGSTTIPVTVSACPSVTNSPSSISITNCAGFQVNWQVSQMVGGSAVTATWATDNASVATVNSSGLVMLSGNAGVAHITSTSSSGTAVTTVTVSQCSAARVDSVTVSPRSWSLIVGGPDVTLTATVWGSAGISQAVTWGNSQPGCVTITSISQNQVTVHALMACANIVITATSSADVTKSGTSTGSVSSGTVTCTARDSTTGAKYDSTTVTQPSGTTQTKVIVTCTNQFGVQFRPWGESNHPEVATIVGSSNININGVNWPAGPYFTITRQGSGTARITFHAAVTDQSVLTWFDIVEP